MPTPPDRSIHTRTATTIHSSGPRIAWMGKTETRLAFDYCGPRQ